MSRAKASAIPKISERGMRGEEKKSTEKEESWESGQKGDGEERLRRRGKESPLERETLQRETEQRVGGDAAWPDSVEHDLGEGGKEERREGRKVKKGFSSLAPFCAQLKHRNR